MDVEDLIGTMLRGTMTGRHKHSHRAYGYLGGGRGSFINASTLLTVGGLIWGAIETMQQQSAASAGTQPPAGSYPAGPASRPASPPSPVVPPLPTGVPPLPVPSPGTAAGPAPTDEQVEAAVVPAVPAGVPDSALRVIRLMLSAARADGNLTPDEKESIQAASREAGAEAEVVRELAQPTPLAAIVAGVTDRQQREDLYVLAFGIVRGDEVVSGTERIYLAQLGALLGLDQATARRLESEAAARIDAQPGA